MIIYKNARRCIDDKMWGGILDLQIKSYVNQIKICLNIACDGAYFTSQINMDSLIYSMSIILLLIK